MTDRTGRWLRLETTWSASEWIAKLKPEQRLCWIELLCYVKAHGLDGKARAMPATIAARTWGVSINAVNAMLTAAAAGDEPALDIGNNTWTLLNWSKYQGDRTASERAKRYRDSQRDDDTVTGVTRDGRSVTPTGTGEGQEIKNKKGNVGNIPTKTRARSPVPTPVLTKKRTKKQLLVELAAERGIPLPEVHEWQGTLDQRIDKLMAMPKRTEAELDEAIRHRRQRDGPGRAQHVGEAVQAIMAAITASVQHRRR